jgi:hypothetical protein
MVLIATYLVPLNLYRESFGAPFFYMAAPTTNSTETELSSVNSILGAIGQSPITRLYIDDERTKTYNYKEQDGTDGSLTVKEPELIYINPEVSFVHNLLMEVDKDVQNEGWVFNRECHYPFPANTDKEIKIPPNVLRLDISENQVYRTSDVVRRGGRLYDKVNHTYKFKSVIYCDVTWLFPYEDLPSVFKRYITSRASVRAAIQLVSNQELVKLLKSEEEQNRAACMEYECNQGDHTMFGWPDGSVYRSYQPYRTLMR